MRVLVLVLVLALVSLFERDGRCWLVSRDELDDATLLPRALGAVVRGAGEDCGAVSAFGAALGFGLV